jgi:hypothetical protein
MRDMASVASEALRSLLHQRWCGLSVPELDALLVELSDVAFRLSEATERAERALLAADKAGGLRLDWAGQQRHASAHEALVSARADLRHGAAAAQETGRWLHDARQATATVGLAFDQDGDEIEEEY